MNLLLLQTGFPPSIVEPKDRVEYINCMQKIDEYNDFADYHFFMLKNLKKSLDIYLDAASKTIK